MNWIEYCSLSALLVYAVASVAVVAGLLGRSARVKRLAFGLTLAGFALHTVLVIGTVAAHAENSRLDYLVPFAWCLVAVGLLASRKPRLDIALLFVAPLAFALLFVAQVLHTPTPCSPKPCAAPFFCSIWRECSSA